MIQQMTSCCGWQNLMRFPSCLIVMETYISRFFPALLCLHPCESISLSISSALCLSSAPDSRVLNLDVASSLASFFLLLWLQLVSSVFKIISKSYSSFPFWFRSCFSVLSSCVCARTSFARIFSINSGAMMPRLKESTSRLCFLQLSLLTSLGCGRF